MLLRERRRSVVNKYGKMTVKATSLYGTEIIRHICPFGQAICALTKIMPAAIVETAFYQPLSLFIFSTTGSANFTPSQIKDGKVASLADAWSAKTGRFYMRTWGANR